MNAIDPNIEMARLQKEIGRKLGMSLDNLIFNYHSQQDGVKLELITVNPKHDQSFLFHTIAGADKVTVLGDMLAYVTQTYRKKQSYTVQWAQKGGELHTSYFRARDMFDVLEKFYHGRNKEEYLIFSITLNPIA